MVEYQYMQWAKQTKMHNPGFTIVELLIVVVVIAILAAITIVAYNGIITKTKESAAAVMVAQAQKKLALYAAANNDQYPVALTDAGIDAVTASNIQYSVNNAVTPAGFCITASKDGTSSYIALSYQYSTSSPQTLNQTTPTVGVCPGHAAAGGVAVVNVIANPAVRIANTGWSAVSSSGGTPSGNRVSSVSGLTSLGITTAYRNTLGGAATSWWRVQYNANIPVVEGRTYTLSGYVRPSVTATTGLIIIWQNSTGGTVSESQGSFTAQTAMTWAQKSVTAVAPAGAVSARYHFGATNNGTAGAFFDATAAMFYEGSNVYGYADGNSAGWIWDGNSDASFSRGQGV